MENKLVVEYVKKVSSKGKVYTALETSVVKEGVNYPIDSKYVDPALALTLDTLGIKCIEKFN